MEDIQPKLFLTLKLYKSSLPANRHNIAIKKSIKCPISIKNKNRCWWDGYFFDTVPVQIPFKYDDNTKKFLCYGNFCSFNCAYAYILSSQKQTKSHEIFLLNKMFESFNKSSQYFLSKAPPKEGLLDEFGGKMSIIEYRKLFHEHDFIHEYDDYGVIAVKPHQAKININKKYVLSRPKPIQYDNILNYFK